MQPGRSARGPAGRGRRRCSSRRVSLIVEPSGPIEDDPNLTDQKFPGNPTRWYRTWAPLHVTGEVIN
ncbi:MAG: NAD(+)--rifampin ADP-ribosyltransferase [Propionibacteriaceae bacterium]|nr:NAD(+)--rifampin ADP-ribosyltransferase [Propionibacteriaceae bacterium]